MPPSRPRRIAAAYVAAAAAALAVGLAMLAPAAATALPSCASAPCASDRGPVVVLSYYKSRHLPRLIRGVRRSSLPQTTPVYYGNYWGSGKPSEPGRRPPPKRSAPRMPGGRFAPIFPIVHSQFWRGRRLPPSLRRVLAHTGATGMAGRLPPLRRLLRRSGAYRYDAGLELGRRFRDRIRSRRAAGRRIVTWQLDELPSELAGRRGRALRQFVRGVLRGLSSGRPALGDRRLPGIVWATGRALTLARHPARGEMAGFWSDLDEAALMLVSEEYPDFVGPPGRAARRHGRFQKLLRRGGGPRAALARRYVVGMTPGYRIGKGLGGNVRGRSRTAVSRWRVRFVRARAAGRPAGYAQFNFRYRNGSPAVINDVLGALARGVRLAAAR